VFWRLGRRDFKIRFGLSGLQPGEPGLAFWTGVLDWPAWLLRVFPMGTELAETRGVRGVPEQLINFLDLGIHAGAFISGIMVRVIARRQHRSRQL
jgi:hypothetical protein